MQITLIQTEVEQALRDYIANRLTLATGTTFEIDLAATRGANGITATINLIEPGEKVVAAALAPTTLKAVKETLPKASEANVATQASTTVEKVSPEPDSAVEATSTVVGEQSEASPAEAEAQETKPVDGETAPATKSLFANLNRPKNA